MSVPTSKGNDYQFNWARVNVKVTDDWYQTEVEYDVSQMSLKKSYARMHTGMKGGEASLLFGKFLNTISYLYPGPASLHLNRYPEALNDIDIYVIGLGIWYQKGDLTFRLAHFNQDTVSTVVTYKGLSAFYHKEVGYGLIAEHEANKYLNPFLGVTWYESGMAAGFVQNHIKLPHHFSLYGQTDFGDFQPLWLAGVNYEIKKNSFLKLFFDTKDNHWHAEVTFSF